MNQESRRNNSLIRGLGILEFIAGSPSGAKVTEIAKAAGLPTSNCTLFLTSLVEAGYVIKNSNDGLYYISNRIGKIAAQIAENRYLQLEKIAGDDLEGLYRHFDENTLLAVLSGYRLKFLTSLQSRRTVQILNNDDRTFIPHNTAAGKALLAFMDKDYLDQYFKNADFKPLTPRTVTDPSLIRKELEAVRENGYAMNRGEYEELVMAVAAPVFLYGTIFASITVQFPTFRYSEGALSDFAAPIKKTAAAIEKSLWEYLQQENKE